MPRARDRYSSVATPQKHAPIKVPLNDDKQEKAKRLQSRQALHETQMNQIRAAATPVRRRQTLTSQSQYTPGDNDENTFHVGGDAVTPMKRVPILANFEEWMKMATDNKINANNSWNFALIDYFHDMSLLKEGDSVNFQRASCTLDGCVKIYTSRIDSVATETGKLLSGLATSNDNKKRRGDDAEGEGDDGDDDEEEGDDGHRKKTRKRAQRSAESTLVSSFAQLQLKKMDMELSVDPLFKKASADFDEGGAKGLLLNHLSIDTNGRIVFDSSDDVQPGQDKAEAEEEDQEQDEDKMDVDGEEAKQEPATQHTDIDISALGARFFPDLSILDGQDICPSLKNFDLGDPDAANLPFLKAPEDWRNENKDDEQGDGAGGFLADGFDDDDDLGAFDLPAETGFGEGGEVWAREAALETQMRVHTMGPDSDDREGEEGMDDVGGFDADRTHYGVTLTAGREQDQENILNYFDKALSKNWAGPEHWRIRRIKDINKANEPGPTKRKEKEPFQIDFSSPMTQSMADALYTSATTSSTISLPKAQWKSKSRNLLPDDKHFNSRQLLRLFLKPKARMGARSKSGSSGNRDNQKQHEPEGEMDEVFWARSEDRAAQNPENEDAPAQGNYDADFFQDDGLGAVGGDEDSDIFADAREMFSPPPEFKEGAQVGEASVLNGNQEGAFGTQLVTQSRRLRPEYVQYARVAKKVDVRRLKEEMWRGIGMGDPEEDIEDSILQNKTPAPSAPMASDGSLKFTDVVNNLQAVYPRKQMADISTSYCFICLLHLANEKGLVIENEENFTDLTIRKDPRAILEGAE